MITMTCLILSRASDSAWDGTGVVVVTGAVVAGAVDAGGIVAGDEQAAIRERIATEAADRWKRSARTIADSNPAM
jgi:hypothetical protein